MGRIKKEKDYISDAEYSSILLRLYKIADELNIQFWLSFGTLLGYAQQKKRFIWDNDIDIGTTSEGMDSLLKNIDLVERYGFYIREKEQKDRCYRGLFIYDKNIQPFHIDISEFIVDKNNRFTFRWLIRMNLPSKCFDYFYKTFLYIIELTNKNKNIPFFDSSRYKNYKENKVINKISKALYKLDMFFTTTRELGMEINALLRIKYYGVEVMIPIPVEDYCAVNYGKNWRIPIKVRHTKGGSDCLKAKIDGIERCYLE